MDEKIIKHSAKFTGLLLGLYYASNLSGLQTVVTNAVGQTAGMIALTFVWVLAIHTVGVFRKIIGE
jgi:hypothetical protein